MQRLQRHVFWLQLVLASCLASPISRATTPPATPASGAMATAKARHASVVILDLATHSTLVSLNASAHGLPGSAIKPLLLQYALAHGILQPGTEVYCRRNLVVNGHRLACTHPADSNVFTAETALAESCNTWFAHLGNRFTASQMADAFRAFHLPSLAPVPQTEADRELTALGLRGPLLTPGQLASAYALLSKQLTPDSPVASGLRGSVNYGMAHPAAIAGLDLLGKTGTAADPGHLQTHGWFAGIVSRRQVIVVFVPTGDGGDAARLAKLLLHEMQNPEHIR